MSGPFTVDQATDLAHHFLGPEWFAWTINDWFIIGNKQQAQRYGGKSWDEVFRMAGVKFPPRLRYLAVGREVLKSGEVVATAVSHTFADRIANALNWYIPGRRGS